jgi:ribosomal protein S18 acetylase RimI-like enzyme
MIQVHTAHISDAGLIADISRETFYETFAEFNSAANMDKFMSEQFSREILMKEVGEAGNIFFIAWDDGDPVGYALLKENEKLHGPGAIEIARIYAKKNWIGKGIGSALINKCMDTARAIGKESVWLGVWERNERAIRFYQERGFEKFGTHIFLLGDDPQTDWLMRKKL